MEDPGFGRYLRIRSREGFQVNVNVLGEAILGDAEADRRLGAVLDRIRRPDVSYVSVKISALCANLDVLAEQSSLDRICERLATVLREAGRATPPVFVNVDMEEYRDLELSFQAFTAVLDRPEFLTTDAGIVLQAYIPDSHDVLRRLCTWANGRSGRGGAGIKVRLVKGANLAMELVDAEMHGWAPATYPTKADVDASYKAMLASALSAGNPQAVRVGVASHNLFDVAWALAVRDSLGPEGASRIEIEMLEGMAPAQARAVQRVAGRVVLYAPVVSRAERDASIAYLSRRLDENSAPENFLRAMFTLTPGSPEWLSQQAKFRTAVAARSSVSTDSRRSQNRQVEPVVFPADGSFRNEPDTDFTVAANRRWVERHLRETVVPAATLVDDAAAIDACVSRARSAAESWRITPWSQRRQVLAAIATVMARDRGRTLGLMAATCAKTVREGDPEVSEAIDFATFAGSLTLGHEAFERAGLVWQPHGVVLVAGPWNFPYAIPACGLVHALAAGAAAILKPAPEARLVGALLVEQLQSAGLPQGLVQLACTEDNDVGRHLITHGGVDHVALTGSLETARMFQNWDPEVPLTAETSGKNAMVITAAADYDDAIRDLIRSAFGHAGQKCSAASLAILDAPVYDDPAFAARLADAVASLPVGPATELSSVVGPLIGPPGDVLRRALTSLEPGETWLVEPRQITESLWSPGVRLGVQPGSWFHLTECFGPVLGLMRARHLDHAIELQNAPVFGLTGGIHSLDPVEVARWLDRVEVGNAYVNRPITGAIVRRQPFGGWKASVVGPGWKPGGPNHLHGYGFWTGDAAVTPTMQQAWSRLNLDRDDSGLACEGNELRYVPADHVIAWVPDPTHPSLTMVRDAANTTGTRLTVLTAGPQGAEQIIELLAAAKVSAADTRVRLLAPAEERVVATAHSAGVSIDRSPICTHAEVEILHWVREQSVATTRHRHGRLLASRLVGPGGVDR
jgi:RHH-type proline utilization regulon transcriptional repressor/proline dehydrogenase/delta 1-pyrroline-5-carboxylate dehydrogenase